MVSKKSLTGHARYYAELEAQKKAIEALMASEKDLITGEMERRGIEEIELENMVVRWSEYSRSSFDSSAFKKDHPDVYSEYQKQSIAHRFSVSV